jgi:hypothetical protein
MESDTKTMMAMIKRNRLSHVTASVIKSRLIKGFFPRRNPYYAGLSGLRLNEHFIPGSSALAGSH